MLGQQLTFDMSRHDCTHRKVHAMPLSALVQCQFVVGPYISEDSPPLG